MMRSWRNYGIMLIALVLFVGSYMYGYDNGQRSAIRKTRYEMRFIEAHGERFIDLIPVNTSGADSTSGHKNTISIWLN